MSSKHPLALALEILKAFGVRGQEVWESHKLSEEAWIATELREAEEDERAPDPTVPARARALRIRRLKRSIAWLKEVSAQKRVRWRWLPVDFTVFVESPVYLNARAAIWREVLEAGSIINSGKFTEAVLTGGIGVAKTTLAIYSQAFQQYYMHCMESAHATLGVDPNSEIATVFQSKTLALAEELDYGRFRSILDNSPWFTTFAPYDRNLKSQIKWPNQILVKPVAGHDAAAIGANVIGGIIDEVNFMAVVEDSKKNHGGEGTHDQAIKNYNAIARRRESRFARMGLVPGLLCLVSSRNYPGQFTDTKEAEAKTNPLIHVYDKRIWELRPERFSFFHGQRSPTLVKLYGEDCPLWFPVFVGDLTRKPRLITREEAEAVPVVDKHLVREVPQEYRLQFEKDLATNLKDVLGVATQAMNPFLLNQDAVAACFDKKGETPKTPSILSRTECDFVTTKLAIRPAHFRRKAEPRWAHVDLALTKDKCGISMGFIEGFARIRRGEEIETLPKIAIDFTLAVQPPKGGEIEFEMIRRIFYAVRNQGINLQWITFDEYQSRDSMQILTRKGFLTGYQSMDLTMDPYEVTKTALYDGRVRMHEHERLLTELVRLEHNHAKAKVDHPANGSKDVADSLTGVVYGLSMRRELWMRHGVPLSYIPPSLLAREGGNKNSIAAKERAGNAAKAPLETIRAEE